MQILKLNFKFDSLCMFCWTWTMTLTKSLSPESKSEFITAESRVRVHQNRDLNPDLSPPALITTCVHTHLPFP